jgi:hypothetical protein
MDYKRTSNYRPIEYVVNEKGCHIGISHTHDKDGYMKIQRNKKCWHAHRWVYTQTYGDIPKGMVVMHSCDEPSCININHLSLGTIKDNNHDMIRKGRDNLYGNKGRKLQ